MKGSRGQEFKGSDKKMKDRVRGFRVKMLLVTLLASSIKTPEKEYL